MKLQAEKIIQHIDLQNEPNAVDQIRVVLSTLLGQACEKKIDWDAKAIDESKSLYTASLHVMNNAEWNAAKDILKALIDKFPDAESDIHRVFGIIDPLGNY